MKLRALVRVAPLLGLTFAASGARAGGAPDVDVRTWAPSSDPRANLVLEPVTTPGPWQFSVGAWTHYERDSVAVTSFTGTVAHPLQDQLGLDITASLGLGKRAEVGLRAPTFLYADGTSGLAPAIVSSGKVPTAGFGNLALQGKGTILENHIGGYGLAALGEATFPTGTSAGFLSDSGPTFTARAVFDVSLLVASLQASLGYTLRTSQVTWPVGTAGRVTFGDSIPWTVGFLVRPALMHAIDPDGRQMWELALHGALPAGPDAPFSDAGAALRPVLLAASNRVELGRYRDWFVLVGADVGLDSAVGVPAFRATLALGLTFADHDADRDGVPDDVDQCRHLAEDRDGFEDADGCPEADNDDDGIVDAEDACPNVKGPPNADPRKNGCP